MRIRAPIGVSFQVWKARWAALMAASTSCGGGKRNFGQHLLGRRVDDVVPLGGLGLDPLAVDQQLYRLDSGFVWRERCVHVGSPGRCSYLESYLGSQGEKVALR